MKGSKLVLVALLAWMSYDGKLHAQLIQRRAVTRPCCKPCIPGQYQYGSKERIGTLFALSTPSLLVSGRVSEKVPSTINNQTGVGLESGSRPSVRDSLGQTVQQTAFGRRQMKQFQWPNTSYQLEHCSISNVSFQLHPDGRWSLSLLATQNGLGSNSDYAWASHIKRNQFGVKMTLFAGGIDSLNSNGQLDGKSAVAQTSQKTFWVEKQQPEQIWLTGQLEIDELSYAAVDRANLQFFVNE
ncbi:MAG: hypothetical protein AAGA30_13875 [Planctomycetota bacterium]